MWLHNLKISPGEWGGKEKTLQVNLRFQIGVALQRDRKSHTAVLTYPSFITCTLQMYGSTSLLPHLFYLLPRVAACPLCNLDQKWAACSIGLGWVHPRGSSLTMFLSI